MAEFCSVVKLVMLVGVWFWVVLSPLLSVAFPIARASGLAGQVLIIDTASHVAFSTDPRDLVLPTT